MMPTKASKMLKLSTKASNFQLSMQQRRCPPYPSLNLNICRWQMIWFSSIFILRYLVFCKPQCKFIQLNSKCLNFKLTVDDTRKGYTHLAGGASVLTAAMVIFALLSLVSGITDSYIPRRTTKSLPRNPHVNRLGTTKSLPRNPNPTKNYPHVLCDYCVWCMWTD